MALKSDNMEQEVLLEVCQSYRKLKLQQNKQPLHSWNYRVKCLTSYDRPEYNASFCQQVSN